MRVDLEALDAGGVAHLFVPKLREADEQPLLPGVAVERRAICHWRIARNRPAAARSDRSPKPE
jgi:hypothetical protein